MGKNQGKNQEKPGLNSEPFLNPSVYLAKKFKRSWLGMDVGKGG